MSSAADPLPAPDAPPTSTPTRPPFWFKRVRIRNYKSIAFCDVTLEPLTLFVGRNGAGKSNFLDALSFLRDFVAYGFSEAVDKHGGPDGVMRRGAAELEVEVEFSLSPGETGNEPCEVTFGLVVEGVDRLVAKREWCRMSHAEGQWPREYEAGPKTIVLSEGKTALREQPRRVTADEAALGIALAMFERHAPEAGWVASFLHGTQVFNFIPEVMRLPQRRTTGSPLGRDGANLANVISEMPLKAEYFKLPSELPRIKQYLEVVVPQIEGIDTATYGGYSVLEFAVAGVPGPLPAASMSDGTLRVLATLVAAFQHSPFVEASAVGFEEPEAALHPAATYALIAALDEASLRRQILLTTHSPALLDAEEVTPDRVRVVEYVDGATRIGVMDEASASIVRDHLNTVGGLEREDRLEIDAADLDRQLALAAGGPAE